MNLNKRNCNLKEQLRILRAKCRFQHGVVPELFFFMNLRIVSIEYENLKVRRNTFRFLGLEIVLLNVNFPRIG